MIDLHRFQVRQSDDDVELLLDGEPIRNATAFDVQGRLDATKVTVTFYAEVDLDIMELERKNGGAAP